MNLILGLVIVVGGWYLIKSFANAQPAKARGLIRKIGGVAVMAFGAFMMVKGEINVAIPMFMLGLGLMGQQAMFPNGMPWQRKTPGQASKVSTSIIAMQLDHDTGRMEGEVLSGAYKGRKLSSLTLPEAQALHAQCAAAPDQSRALFESWIERTRPEWRAAWNSRAGRAAATTSQKMTRGEALAILGIKEGATEDDIRAAHRRLMKTAHPDLGGSDYLAAKINEAKEYLLQKS